MPGNATNKQPTTHSACRARELHTRVNTTSWLPVQGTLNHVIQLPNLICSESKHRPTDIKQVMNIESHLRRCDCPTSSPVPLLCLEWQRCNCPESSFWGADTIASSDRCYEPAIEKKEFSVDGERCTFLVTKNETRQDSMLTEWHLKTLNSSASLSLPTYVQLRPFALIDFESLL